MSIKVVLSEPAQDDLDGITRYISDTLENRTAARNLLVAVDKAIDDIGFMPSMFPVSSIPSLSCKKIHVYHVHGIGICYSVGEGRVMVLLMRSDRMNNSSEAFIQSLLDAAE